MARTREQVIQEQLGAMAMQLAILSADLEQAQERIKALEGMGNVPERGTPPSDPGRTTVQ